MGYLHNLKPKITGGYDQGEMKMDPEVKGELLDVEGKHKISGSVKGSGNADPLKTQEAKSIKNETNQGKQDGKSAFGESSGDATTKSNPFHPGQAHKASAGSELKKLKKSSHPKGSLSKSGKEMY